MGLSEPQSIFGVHSITTYNPDTLVPYGTAKVVGSAALNLSGELTPLNGGSSAYPWRVERGLINTELTLTLKEYPDFLFPSFLGKSITSNAAEANGAVAQALTNAKGTSVLDASTGIDNVGVKSGSEADVKTGLYAVVAVTATTVDVYAMTDVDFAQGTDLTFVDDSLKVNSSPLTITASTAVDIPNLGVELTGGSGTIGMTADDTAFFELRTANTSSKEVVIGANNESYVDVGVLIAGQKSGSKAITYLDIYRAIGVGIPINFTEQAFSEAEITMQAFRDTDRNGVFAYRRVNASN